MLELSTDSLQTMWDYVVLCILSFGGATVNLLLYVAGGQPVSKSMAAAILLSGTLLGTTGAGIIGTYMGIGLGKGMGLGFCAVMTGMLGIKIASGIMTMDLSFMPFFKKGGS